MDPVTVTQPRVRPRFRRWAAIAGVLVIILLAHTMWDYFESGWLKTAMATWAPGYGAAPIPVALPPERDAAPYYRAAASLLAGRSADIAKFDNAMRREISGGSLSEATLDRLGQILAANDEGLALLDRATERDFAGFSSYRTANVSELQLARRVASMRALYAALRGDGTLAVRSLQAELKLESVQRTAIPEQFTVSEWMLSWGRSVTVSDLQFVLSHVAPDSTSLDRLAEALANADDDTEFARFFTSARDLWTESYLNRVGGPSYDGSFGASGLFGAGRGSLWNRIFRPVIARDLRWKLEHYAQIIEAATTAWPDRIDRIVATRAAPGWLRLTLGERLAIYPGHPGWAEDEEAWWQLGRLRIAATDLAGVRAARVAVAIERYRRAHAGQLPASPADLTPAVLPTMPIDPFSGKPMLFAAHANDYVVYSVGPNRIDDGGQEAGTKAVVSDERRGPQPRMTGDVGVRVHITSK